MKHDRTASKIFIYPKFESLVNLTTNEVTLDQENQAWLEEVIAEYFNDGIKSISHFRIRPWSKIFKVQTNYSGSYFLKIPTPEFKHEAQIINLIQSFNSDITTKIIVRNPTNGSFLMEAIEGETLRMKIRREEENSLLVSSAATIGNFQKNSREHLSSFEQLGIPKWTSETMIEDFESLIQSPRFLELTALSSLDLKKFRSLFPYIQEKLSVLTRLDNGLSIDHGDFQDNNIFISKYQNVFFDWADASITIPSFTIGTYCHSILLAHPSIDNKSKLIQNILTQYYCNLLGTKNNKFHESHPLLVHYLYPMMCILQVKRLFNLEDKKLDKYASTIIDYWIQLVISFSGIYRDKTLSNEIV